MTVPEINLIFDGDPVGKERPKFNTQTKVAYTPKKTVIAEREIRSLWREAGKPRLADEALELEIQLYVQRPQSHFKKNGELTAEGLRHPVPRNKKPDVDNAIKLVMDALNKHAYKDDVQIAKATVLRFWGDWPKTVIRVKELDVQQHVLHTLQNSQEGRRI